MDVTSSSSISAISAVRTNHPASTPKTSSAEFLVNRHEAQAGYKSAKGEIRTDPAAPPIAKAGGADGDAFSFFDFLDIINPLQHIPGVNIAYRALTGDEIKPAPALAGGTLFGGPIGGAIALASSVFAELFSAGQESGADNKLAARAVSAEPHNPARPDIFKSAG